jgi:hypothetical protein
MLYTREHDDLMEMFEREYRGHRLDREAKELWVRGNVYQNGETNTLFLAYRRGYALGKVIGRED